MTLGNFDLTGILHVHVAFDIGEEIDLEHAQQLVPAEFYALPRRRRTPTSIDYRPAPLRLRIDPIQFPLPELGVITAPAETTLFDFGGVSIAMHIPFTLPAEGMRRLAGYLAEPKPVVQAVKQAFEPFHTKILPCIVNPFWSNLSEEYFVFQFPPSGQAQEVLQSFRELADWLAGLLRLEQGPLSAEEIAEATRLRLNYSPNDFFIADWAAAVLWDSDCEETLQAIEFANLQLLEYRHIDNRLDDNVNYAYKLIQPRSRARFPFWTTYAVPMRALGELRFEANGLFERTGNVLKLVGDQYLARVYQLVATRFHLEEWEGSIQRKLDVIEGVYKVLFNQASAYRMEFLEAIIIILFLLEIFLAFL